MGKQYDDGDDWEFRKEAVKELENLCGRMTAVEKQIDGFRISIGDVGNKQERISDKLDAIRLELQHYGTVLFGPVGDREKSLLAQHDRLVQADQRRGGLLKVLVGGLVATIVQALLWVGSILVKLSQSANKP